MKNLSKKKKTTIIILSILIIISIAFGAYEHSKVKLFDKAAYSALYKNLEASADSFNSQSDLRKFITSWADDCKLKYTVDEAKNIIFTQKAAKKKQGLSPAVILVNYNYENVLDNKKVLASAASIASTKINSTKTTVIFVNNENNDGESYYQLNRELLPKKAKVIYLDYGTHMYCSNKSFASAVQTIAIPTEEVETECDTAIKIKISGLKSDVVDTSINNRVNPISLFSTVLTRLKSKSTICQITDIKVHNKGNMYPDSLEAKILINSYSLESFTKYLDKRIEAFNKACDDETCTYTYKVLKDSKIPDVAYSTETFNALTSLLFTIDDRAIRFDEDSIIPDDYEEKDINTIICPTQLRFDYDQMYLDVYLQAVNSDYLNQALKENATAAKLSNCSVYSSYKNSSFKNSHDKFIHELQKAYFKVTVLSGTASFLKLDADTYFTPMTYLKDINPNMDIVHIKENSISAATLTNSIIYYIQNRGNFLSL